MTGASSLAYPGSRTLANWWRQLGPYEPHSIWVGYLFLHRVEARVALIQNRHLDPLSQVLLQALELELGISTGQDPVLAIDGRLHLGSSLIRQLLHGLTAAGLLQATGGQRWTLTELGRGALSHGHYPWPSNERRVFTFVERLDLSGRRVSPPHFLAIADSFGTPWEAGESAQFNVEALRACPSQSDEWKATFGFPSEVQSVLTHSDESAWREVVIDRPERLLLVLIQGKKEMSEPRLLGFAARPDGWVLESREPIINLPAAARSFSSELEGTPDVDVWPRAWQSWCQTRNLPALEVNACQVLHAGPRLRVTAPPRLVQRLQASRSDIFKSDAWVLAGDGYLRQGVCLELHGVGA